METGECVAETEIVYAAPTSSFGACTLAQPCGLSDAITLAKNAQVPPIVRMLPGTYTTSIEVTSGTLNPLEIVATGASVTMVGDTAAIVLQNGANVDIRGLSSISQAHVHCGLSTGAISTLKLQDVLLSALGSGADDRTQIEIERCTLKLNRVEIAFNNSSIMIGTRDDASIEADRVYAHGNATASIVFSGSRQNARMTNSLLPASD